MLLACPERHFLRAVFVSSFRRITAAFPYADDVLLRSIAKSIEDGCVSEAVASGTSSLNTAEAVFRRLVPDTAGAIHIHRSITGITADPARTLREIFERHVEAAVDHTQAWEEGGVPPARSRGAWREVRLGTGTPCVASSAPSTRMEDPLVRSLRVAPSLLRHGRRTPPPLQRTP
ncbi:MAG: DUF3037 domain-containing protein [Sandaracinaceae bacterium]|nr:DUF3037 domain-containing protein [Sandaracinaceae bacterium]